MFVESRFRLENKKAIVPDLVICKHAEVAAFVEIKFVPSLYPVWEPDIEKFQHLLRESNCEYSIKCNPTNGKMAATDFRMTDQTTFIFAVIGNEESGALHRGDLERTLSENHRSRLIHAVGIVSALEPPKFFAS